MQRAMSALVMLVVVVAAASAQYRPSYAPNGFIYPAPREPERDAALDNRFGGSSTTEGPLVDRFGFDMKLVKDAERYPEDRKPFWFQNREAIATHIGRKPAPSAAAEAPSTSGNTTTASPSA